MSIENVTAPSTMVQVTHKFLSERNEAVAKLYFVECYMLTSIFFFFEKGRSVMKEIFEERKFCVFAI